MSAHQDSASDNSIPARSEPETARDVLDRLRPRFERPNVTLSELAVIPLVLWDVVASKQPALSDGAQAYAGSVRTVVFRIDLDVIGVIGTGFLDYYVITDSARRYPGADETRDFNNGTREFRVTFRVQLTDNPASLRAILKTHLQLMADTWAKGSNVVS